MNKRLTEVLAMLLAGDGLLTVLQPKRHCLLWMVGPKSWRDLLDPFLENPGLSRLAGAVELIFGLLLAAQQKPGLKEHLGRAL